MWKPVETFVRVCTNKVQNVLPLGNIVYNNCKNIENCDEITLLTCSLDYSTFTILKSDFEEKQMALLWICVRQQERKRC